MTSDYWAMDKTVLGQLLNHSSDKVLNPLTLTRVISLILSKIKTWVEINPIPVLTLEIMDLLNAFGKKSGQELVPFSQTLPYAELPIHDLLFHWNRGSVPQPTIKPAISVQYYKAFKNGCHCTNYLIWVSTQNSEGYKQISIPKVLIRPYLAHEVSEV